MSSLLPITSSSPLPSPSRRTNNFSSSRSSGGSSLGWRDWKTKLRKLTKVRTMDFEMAVSNLTYLCVSPRRVYRNVYYHKQTKNQWARDDPAMILLICLFLFTISIPWSLLYHHTLVQTLLTTPLIFILRDFLFSSCLIATFLWALTNKLLLSSPTHSNASSDRVEWAFAFDVAVNSFFTFSLSIYVGQLLLSGIIMRDNWVCLFIGNTLWLTALSQYIYITYLGYSALPFLIRSEVLLAPLLPVFVGYIISLLGFNVSKTVLSSYFG